MAIALKPTGHYDHDRKIVAESLMQVWEWADRNVSEIDKNGTGRVPIGDSPALVIDAEAGIAGFAEAMVAAGWLRLRADTIEFPHYDRHNGSNAKTRARNSLNQATRRSRTQKQGSVTSTSLFDSDKSESREEKRRESKKKKKKKAREIPISWSEETGWVGILPSDVGEWAEAFPACDINRQLKAMSVWLRANPVKAKKTQWARFIVNWLIKEQDSGGDTKSKQRTGQSPGRHGSSAGASAIAAEARRAEKRARECPEPDRPVPEL